jgi:hypothetical protein
MYRYRIQGEGFEFEHEEDSYPLRAGDIITRGNGPERYKVVRVRKEARSAYRFTPPFLNSRGVVEAEKFVPLRESSGGTPESRLAP